MIFVINQLDSNTQWQVCSVWKVAIVNHDDDARCDFPWPSVVWGGIPVGWLGQDASRRGAAEHAGSGEAYG